MSEEHACYDSRAKEIIAYSYLHELAPDGTLHDRDAEFMKHLVLKDGVIDDEEAIAIHRILRHIEGRPVSHRLKRQIEIFRKLYPEKNYTVD